VDLEYRNRKGKGKGNPVTGPGEPIGWVELQLNSFLTSAQKVVCGQHHGLAAFNPGKDPVTIVQKAGWATEPVWIGAENLAPPGFDPRTFQPVASRYTDWAIPALSRNRILEYYLDLGDGNLTYCVVTGYDAVKSGRWYVSE
jgi:hypothetical protein